MKVALCATVLLGSATLTVDLGWARMVRAQLENAADAAAHAGAAQLDGTDEGIAAALSMAASIGAAHEAGGTPVTLEAGEIETGVWDPDVATFTPSIVASEANAVRVNASRPSLALFFAPAAFGKDTVAVGASATALAKRGGAGGVACVLPIAIPQCLFDVYGGVDGLHDLDLNPNPPSMDTMGWGRPNGNPNAAWSKDQIRDCTQSGEARIDDPVGLSNGVVTSALDAMVTAISESDTRWEEDQLGTRPSQMARSSIPSWQYGQTFEGAIIVFDGGPEYCEPGGGSYTGTRTIVGFAWAVFYDVRNNGGAASRTLRARVDPIGAHEVGTVAGGPEYGVTGTDPPRIVAAQ